MTIYAGETVVFKTEAKDVDDAETTLTDTDVTSTEVRILDSAQAVIVASGTMTWDSTDLEWRYVWTTPVTPDTFTAKLRLIGPTFDTWEYVKVKTKTQPSGF
jgi:hypothetical protein